MASYITVSSRKEFNVRLWSKAAQQRQYSYVQTDGVPRRVVPAEDGEPPGQNDGMKNLHLNWVQHWPRLEPHLEPAAPMAAVKSLETDVMRMGTRVTNVANASEIVRKGLCTTTRGLASVLAKRSMTGVWSDFM
ncbi:hypothetical protein WJX75_002036 [Coccomyxa subellipsoidea]|uniref:Uncharacterized protein n=1 Tax=Coccomyxa subellipsoidea TaxID=248742 RepID=A0ABR2YEU1_9CHLO